MYKNKTFLAIIPARGESKRLPLLRSNEYATKNACKFVRFTSLTQKIKKVVLGNSLKKLFYDIKF